MRPLDLERSHYASAARERLCATAPGGELGAMLRAVFGEPLAFKLSKR